MRKMLLYVLAVVLVVGVAVSALLWQPQEQQPTIKYFSSYSDLSDFVSARSEGAYYPVFGATAMREAAVQAAPAPAAAGAAEYSTTNIQVAGVDEPDIIKTDGKYIYTVTQDGVTIVDAFPADAATISSRIQVNGGITGMFVNSDRLVVFTSGGWYGSVGPVLRTGVATEAMVAPGFYSSGSAIYVYDISDRANPRLVRNITVDGNYYDARMIGDYVYTIINQPVQVLDTGPVLPVIRVGTAEKEMPAEQIAYTDVYDTSFVYSHVIAINTQSDSEEPAEKVFLLGYSQNLFVSPDNIYIVYTKTLSYTEYNKRIIDAIIPELPGELRSRVEQIWSAENITPYEKMSDIGRLIQNYAEGLGPEAGATFMRGLEEKAQAVAAELEKEREKTVIHKIGVSGANIEYRTSGEVPGRVLNQFSMDEYNSNFRIATTTGQSWQETSLNHVYVLNPDLQVIGKLENLARTEQIFSARFIGDRAYLVTFRRTDPLFVIDLSNPIMPRVLGELKMPGFSEYLHPYDADYLIGVGQQTDEAGRTTGQIKLALFDVADVANPFVKSEYLIGESGDWAYTEVLNDHKAFLFSRSKNLLVIPVSINNWRADSYSQGAYVFDLTVDGGFQLRGDVTHIVTNASEEEQYYDYSSAVRRSLYMDNTLWTVSDKFARANSLADLGEVAMVKLE